ncbi:putative disease resistance RPP13-like protein 1 [Aristolochia californica]|uniref:putative disease resistance RPP13-like protein 1 n=1 Tax=Aristolochia californica TaxID=171875 RepID=UPI0035E0B7A4
MASKIEDVLEKLDDIIDAGNDLRLREGVGGRTLEMKARPETTSLVDEDSVFGRDMDKETVISLLLSNDPINNNISVITIFGMGGLGKTTLAQLAYNDQRVKECFDLQIWVFVSHEFDAKRVTRSIIESITNAKYDLLDLDPMQRYLQKLLAGKKFLLVLDDVWTECFGDWDCLKHPFRVGMKESKIIVTTRSESVSRIMDATSVYRLECLQDEDCWSLIKQRVSGEGQKKLAEIQGEIVEKCKGLPLAAKTLAGLLCTMKEDKWDSILESELWYLPQGKDDILPALKLSYLLLPPHLKRCFTYCSLFPKGCIFSKDELVQFWMAEGFIRPDGRKPLEDIGNDYFEDLLARSFFQKNWLDYVMHDLIHDLAQFLSGSLCFQLMSESIVHSHTEMTRHLSLTYLDQSVLDYLCEIKGLRTFWGEEIMRDSVLQSLLQNMKCLRVLDLRFSQITHIPDSIGNLKHLRYLNLSETPLQKLPDSICQLHHLQSLLLAHCEYLIHLPSDMKSFCSMRHLSIYGTMIHVLPDSICYLEELQVLDLGCTELVELPANIGKLINLRSLNLQHLNIKKLPDSVCMLYNLERLNIKGCYGLCELPKDMVNLIKLRNLKVDSELLRKSFPPGIGRLTCLQKLKYYPVGKEPGRGIGELKDLFDLHGELNISDIDNVSSVEEAHVANLMSKQHIKHLQLQWNGSTLLSLRDGTVDAELLEALQPPCQNLKHLILENYAGVRFPNWLGFTSFSCLVYVQLMNCNRCDTLPPLGKLPSLIYLVIKRIDGVKHVGLEFCGNVGDGAFPSLRKLEVEDMPNLEDWCAGRESDFHSLNDLSISFCPKLKELQVGFNNLKKLRLLVCDELTALPPLPSLEVLQLHECKESIIQNSLPYLTSLSTLKISQIDGLKTLPDGLLQPLTVLRKLEIENCYELSSFPDGLPTLLTDLSISHCPLLRSSKGKYILPNIVNLSIDLPILPVLPRRSTCRFISPKFKFELLQ